MKKNYLAIFFLPQPQNEHLRIVEVIRSASKGDFKQAPLGGVGTYLYSSELAPHQLAFDRIIHNADTMLIIEVGSEIRHQGFGSFAGFLSSHRPGSASAS